MAPTILLLEDDADLRDDWCAELERAGMRVLQAARASEALSQLALEPVDLVVADIFIEAQGRLVPDGGISLLGACREARLAGRAAPPVVAVTGELQSGSHSVPVLDLAVSLGAVDRLAKPVLPGELLACVKRNLAVAWPARVELASS